MKKITITMALLFAVTIFVSAQNSDLERWVNKTNNQNSSESKKVSKNDTKYRLISKNGKYVCETKLVARYHDAAMLFPLAMEWFIKKGVYGKKGILNFDENKRMFKTDNGFKKHPGLNPEYYFRCNIACSIKDDTLSIMIYNCQYSLLKFAAKTKYIPFEERYDLNKTSGNKKEELQEFYQELTNYIDNLHAYIKKNRLLKPVTHWDEIKRGTVIIGMTDTECILSWGMPIDRNSTRYDKHIAEQWVYDNDQYLYLDDFIVKSIQN